MELNKGDKIIVTNPESIWDGYEGKIMEIKDDEPENPEIVVKINFESENSDEMKFIIQKFLKSELVLNTKNEMLTEEIEIKDHKFVKNNDYVKKYLLKFNIDGDLEPAWIFADTIATSLNKDVGCVLADAEKFGHKLFRVTAQNFDKLIIADKSYTADDIKNEYGDFLLGITSVEECSK